MKSTFQTTTAQHPQATEGDQSALCKFGVLLRKLEPMVGASIAAETGWLATDQGLPILWTFSLFALATAGWAVARAKVSQAEIALRGIALLAASYLVHTDATVEGGASGAFFFWLGVTAIYYVLILQGPYLGSLSRRLSCADGEPRTDSCTALYNRGGLLAHGKALLADCRADGRELTLAVFDCNDLLEARAVYGDRTSRKLVDSIVRKLTLLAGNGLAARTGPTQFALAMPMSRDRAVQTIERLLGNPARFELENSRNDIVLVPHLMIEAVPPAGTVERMFQALCRGLARVQEEERLRHQYLQRERERHSRPMPIRAAEQPVLRPERSQLLDPDPIALQHIPTTIPMPLPSR